MEWSWLTTIKEQYSNNNQDSASLRTYYMLFNKTEWVVTWCSSFTNKMMCGGGGKWNKRLNIFYKYFSFIFFLHRLKLTFLPSLAWQLTFRGVRRDMSFSSLPLLQKENKQKKLIIWLIDTFLHVNHSQKHVHHSKNKSRQLSKERC